jgi:hypothetical protein
MPGPRDPRDPFANLDPSKLVALDGEEERPKVKPAAGTEIQFAPPKDEVVLELDLPPPRRGVTAPHPPPLPQPRPTGPQPRTTGPLPRPTGPVPPRTTGPLPPRTTEPLPPRMTGPLPPRTTAPLLRPSGAQLEAAAAQAVAAAAAREGAASAPPRPPAPAPAPAPPPAAKQAAPPPPAHGATTLPDDAAAETRAPNPRMAFAGGMALALGIGFLPAHLYASFAERAYVTIRDEATHVEPAASDAVYQAEVDERDAAIAALKRTRLRIAALTALVWLACSGALGFAWLRLVQSRLPADE